MTRYLVAAVCLLALLVVIVLLKADRDSLVAQLETSRAEVSGLKESIEKSRAALAARDEIDRKHTKELADAKRENDQLRADVAAGSRRVLVRASCPAVPSGASAAGLDAGTEPSLDATAREDYFSLRDLIAVKEKQLAGLQEYVSNVCLGGSEK